MTTDRFSDAWLSKAPTGIALISGHATGNSGAQAIEDASVMLALKPLTAANFLNNQILNEDEQCVALASVTGTCNA